jgi:hypothetical protein
VILDESTTYCGNLLGPARRRAYRQYMTQSLAVLAVSVVALLAAAAFVAYLCGLALSKRAEPVRDRLSMATRYRRTRGDEPHSRPIEQIVADLRRLGLRYHRLDPRASYAKVEAVRAAYDRVLAECCTSLGITHLLEVLPPGPQLDAERERVEDQLAGSGVKFPRAA